MSKPDLAKDLSFSKEAAQTVKEERAIQRKVDRSDKRSAGKREHIGAMQAGARLYPEPPFPKQHLKSRDRKPIWSFRRA